MIVGFNERDLVSNGKKAFELLQTLLNASAGTYMIVDGLDEMEEIERRILLQRFDDLVSSCSELKILICSRPEDDIAKALGKKSKSLRVDKRNTASIQGFVDHKTEEWIASQDFDQNAAFEIASLLSPLAARANGMFLYARIVLDNLMELSSAEEVRQELKALPRDLDDAYHRIFDRINSSRPQLREKTRKVLGWIGCTSTAMTSFEIEQALLLDGPIDSIDEFPSVVGRINFVKLCGPIVEIVDDRPQFVHFTVREYIFNSQIDNFIDMAFANVTLAIANVSYLCSGVLDLGSTDSKTYIQDNILAGNYRLLCYAAWHWVDLILAAAPTSYLRHKTNYLETLNSLIARAASELDNYNFEPDDQTLNTNIKDCTRTLGSGRVKGHEILLAACRFGRDERQPDWTVTNADTWVNLDPLVTSKIVVRVKEHFESLLCNEGTHSGASAKPCKSECHWATLQRHYGPRLYKCSYYSCPYSREGFISGKDRDSHEKAHSRLWKCPSITCQFSVIGFVSRHRRDIHVKRFHQDESEPMALDADKIAASDFDNLDEHEVQPLLFALVRAGNVEAVKRLQASLSGTKVRAGALYAARTSAAIQGSLAMTQLLTPKDESYLPTKIVTYAVQSGDDKFVKWALAKADSRDIEAGKLNKVMLDTPSNKIYSLWETMLLPLRNKTLLKPAVFNYVKDNPLREQRLVHTWKKLLKKGSDPIKKYFDTALLELARSTTSVRLGKALLELGASTEFSSRGKNGTTALSFVAKKTTREAAEFMKMLIEHGADVIYDEYDFGNEVGAQGIQRWLGVTWQELVEQYEKSPKRRNRRPRDSWSDVSSS